MRRTGSGHRCKGVQPGADPAGGVAEGGGGAGEDTAFSTIRLCYQGYRCQEIIDLLERYRVSRCFYGHLHGGSHRLAISGRQGGVEYDLVSADYLGFQPKKILD